MPKGAITCWCGHEGKWGGDTFQVGTLSSGERIGFLMRPTWNPVVVIELNQFGSAVLADTDVYKERSNYHNSSRRDKWLITRTRTMFLEYTHANKK